MLILIKNGTVVNEGKVCKANVVVDGEYISKVTREESPRSNYDKVIDATGCFVFPGIIDSHVHFREPGITDKADMETESRAAAYGGVTSYFEMPNTNPQTTTIAALDEKFKLASAKSHVNYSFFFGATNTNVNVLRQLDVHRIPGIKLFMGSSTGNMLVDKREALQDVFKVVGKMKLPLVAHCEDTQIINRNMEVAKEKYGEDPDVKYHSWIRSEEACCKSSLLAVELAHQYATHLHIAHVSTEKELELLGNEELITGEAVIAHLYFSDEDYAKKGTLIKCNPAIKTIGDRKALRKALVDGKIATIATDHAPHELKDKMGGCAKAASGMPMVQFSLVTMLELVDEGVLDLKTLVELMAHNPARLFHVEGRGFLREGYAADIVIVRPDAPWVVDKNMIQSKCKWSPMEGHVYRWRIEQTLCNGHLIYDRGQFDATARGKEISFTRPS